MLRFVIILISLLLPVIHSRDANLANHEDGKKITLAVASSLTLPLEEIASKFEKKYHSKVDLSFASSGVLTAQIIHGAPFDVFISANLDYPQKLEKLGKTSGSTKVFALASLVLWSKKDLKNKLAKNILLTNKTQTLAIANPELAPFGEAALRWLKEKKLYKKIKPRLVYGENIGSVNQFIASGAVDVALTSVSALNAPQLNKKGSWRILPKSEISGIPHGAVVISQTQAMDAAKTFLHYLFSAPAQAVFENYGYMKPAQKS